MNYESGSKKDFKKYILLHDSYKGILQLYRSYVAVRPVACTACSHGDIITNMHHSYVTAHSCCVDAVCGW